MDYIKFWLAKAFVESIPLLIIIGLFGLLFGVGYLQDLWKRIKG